MAALPVLAKAHVRIARPTNDIPALLPFYVEGLGFRIIGGFTAHAGFDGIMLGHEGSGYHLEFTKKIDHDPGRAPTQDNLLIFYLESELQYRLALDSMTNAGLSPVKSFNPYWDRCGKTFEDPDGYRVVLASMSWENKVQDNDTGARRDRLESNVENH
jgi:hypothetical protein